MAPHKTGSTKQKKSGKRPGHVVHVDPPPHIDPLHAALTELEGLRDDIRVRIHLAGMELKQAFGDLDRRYLALRDVASHAKEDALAKAKHGLDEVRKELHDLRGRLPGGSGQSH